MPPHMPHNSKLFWVSHFPFADTSGMNMGLTWVVLFPLCVAISPSPTMEEWSEGCYLIHIYVRNDPLTFDEVAQVDAVHVFPSVHIFAEFDLVHHVLHLLL